jgi:hypothetical protein
MPIPAFRVWCYTKFRLSGKVMWLNLTKGIFLYIDEVW